MATKLAHKRLTKEYQAMQKAPPPFIYARFEEKNILDWHFILRGPPDSPYHGGEYHGLIMFPGEYPFKPPDIKFFTPTGRFEINTKICMSMTSFHPSTWNAAWSVATILTGLLSFMLADEITSGSIKTTDDDKKRFAAASHSFNISNKKFVEVFPEYSGFQMKDLPDMGQQPGSSSSAQPVNTDSSSSPTPPQTSEDGQANPSGGDTGEVIAPSAPAPAPAASTLTIAPLPGPETGTVIPPEQHGFFSKYRWWAVVAFVAFIISRFSTL